MPAVIDDVIGSSINSLQTFLDNPHVFVSKLPDDKQREILITLKRLFEFGKKYEDKPLGPLPHLYIDGFDYEQIWEEIELQNKALVKFASSSLHKLNRDVDSVTFAATEGVGVGEEAGPDAAGDDVDGVTANDEEAKEDENTEDGDEEGDEEDEVEEGLEEEEEEVGTEEAEEKDEGPKSALDDGFFRLDDMETFLEDAEKEAAGELEENKEQDEEEDMYEEMYGRAQERENGDEEDEDEEMDTLYADMADGDDEDDDQAASGSEEAARPKKKGKGQQASSTRELRYRDFFDPPARNNPSRPADPGKDSASFPAANGESSLERSHARLRRQIEELEETNVAEKPWTLIGEVSAKQRPQNSLLEAVVEYDQAQKPAPVITQETTQELEQMIKRRVIDGMFDDVIRKLPPAPTKKKHDVELDSEKSKTGLGQIYEKDYMRNVVGVREPDEVSKQKENISKMFASLCHKLDALSNFHFTPKPVLEDVRITTNAPAITMEEVTPAAVSDATLLAPEEVYQKPATEIKSQSELTSEERKRVRGQKKEARRKRKRQDEANERAVERANPGLGNPRSKEKVLKELRELTAGSKTIKTAPVIDGSKGRYFSSSKAFFTKLQTETASGANGAVKSKGSKGHAKQKTASSVQFKL